MTIEQIKGYIDQSKDIPTINYFFIEGGEPFLYPQEALEGVRYAVMKGYWMGILSNGFWAKTLEKGIEILKPFKDAGLGEIGISTDKFHQEKVPFNLAVNAAEAAVALEVPVNLMVTTDDERETRQLRKLLLKRGAKVQLWPSAVRGRGRGADICQGKPTKWQDLTKCSENLSDPGRVHIGLDGAVHLCQGLLIGADATKNRLKNIFGDYLSSKNVIVEALIKGGPAELARFAIEVGFKPKTNYLQDCQLCFEARRFLCKQFPDILGPRENYFSGED